MNHYVALGFMFAFGAAGAVLLVRGLVRLALFGLCAWALWHDQRVRELQRRRAPARLRSRAP